MHGGPNLETLPAPLQPLVLDALSRDPARRPSPAEIGQRVAAIDPGALIPSPPAIAARLAAGDTMIDEPPGGGLGGLNGGPAPGAPPAATGTDQDRQAWPSTTRPLTTSRPGDVRDLLPPVSYRPTGRAGFAGSAGRAAPPGADLARAGAGLAGQPPGRGGAPRHAAGPAALSHGGPRLSAGR